MEILALPSPYVDYIYIILISLITASCSLFRPEAITKLTPFALALTAFYITIGTKWSSDKLVPVIFIMGYFIYVTAHKNLKNENIPINALLLTLFLVCASTLLGFFYLPEHELMTTDMQRPGIRAVVRGASYIASLFYFTIPLLFLHKIRDKLSLQKAYVYAGVVLAVYAIYQYIAFHTGLPYRGIKYWEGTFGVGGLETMGGLFRANGLANEPKQLSMYCITAALCSLISGRYLPAYRKKFAIIAVLNGIGFALAYSGSGLLALSLFLLTCLILMFKQKNTKYSITQARILYSIIFIILLIIITGKLTNVRSFADKLIFERANLSFSLDKTTENERVDYYLTSLFISSPSFIITGFGMGNHPFWVFDKYKVGMHRTRGLQAADSGWLTLLADFGIVSIIIFIIVLSLVIKEYLAIKQCNMSVQTRTGIEASFYCLMLSVCLMLFVAAFNLLMFWLGMFYAFKYIYEIELKNRPLTVNP